MIFVTSGNCDIGINVKRGRDWESGTQDQINGKQVIGQIAECQNQVAKVTWDGGASGTYHIGASNKYELHMIAGKVIIRLQLKWNTIT